MPRVTHLAEAALYVDDLERSVAFYSSLLGTDVLRRDERFCALRIAEGQVLLLFRRGASRSPAVVPGGSVPGHDGAGPLHLCLGIAASDLLAWEQRLQEHGIHLESRVRWPGTAVSLYFRDPDGHAIELATPGIWS